MGTLSHGGGEGSHEHMGIQEEKREKDSKEGFRLAEEPGADERVRCLWQTFEKPGGKIQQTHLQQLKKGTRTAAAVATMTLLHVVAPG